METADAEFGLRAYRCQAVAAIGRFAPILEVREDEWDETMRTNLKSVYLTGCHAFIPRMVDAGGGVFVNISSVNAEVANPSSAPYAASKAAINGLTRNIALDYGPKGIRANAIAPGAIFTRSAASELDEEEARSVRDNYPIGRWGRPKMSRTPRCTWLRTRRLSSQAWF